MKLLCLLLILPEVAAWSASWSTDGLDTCNWYEFTDNMTKLMEGLSPETLRIRGVSVDLAKLSAYEQSKHLEVDAFHVTLSGDVDFSGLKVSIKAEQVEFEGNHTIKLVDGELSLSAVKATGIVNVDTSRSPVPRKPVLTSSVNRFIRNAGDRMKLRYLDRGDPGQVGNQQINSKAYVGEYEWGCPAKLAINVDQGKVKKAIHGVFPVDTADLVAHPPKNSQIVQGKPVETGGTCRAKQSKGNYNNLTAVYNFKRRMQSSSVDVFPIVSERESGDGSGGNVRLYGGAAAQNGKWKVRLTSRPRYVFASPASSSTDTAMGYLLASRALSKISQCMVKMDNRNLTTMFSRDQWDITYGTYKRCGGSGVDYRYTGADSCPTETATDYTCKCNIYGCKASAKLSRTNCEHDHYLVYPPSGLFCAHYKIHSKPACQLDNGREPAYLKKSSVNKRRSEALKQLAVKYEECSKDAVESLKRELVEPYSQVTDVDGTYEKALRLAGELIDAKAAIPRIEAGVLATGTWSLLLNSGYFEISQVDQFIEGMYIGNYQAFLIDAAFAKSLDFGFRPVQQGAPGQIIALPKEHLNHSIPVLNAMYACANVLSYDHKYRNTSMTILQSILDQGAESKNRSVVRNVVTQAANKMSAIAMGGNSNFPVVPRETVGKQRDLVEIRLDVLKTFGDNQQQFFLAAEDIIRAKDEARSSIEQYETEYKVTDSELDQMRDTLQRRLDVQSNLTQQLVEQQDTVNIRKKTFMDSVKEKIKEEQAEAVRGAIFGALKLAVDCVGAVVTEGGTMTKAAADIKGVVEGVHSIESFTALVKVIKDLMKELKKLAKAFYKMYNLFNGLKELVEKLCKGIKIEDPTKAWKPDISQVVSSFDLVEITNQQLSSKAMREQFDAFMDNGVVKSVKGQGEYSAAMYRYMDLVDAINAGMVQLIPESNAYVLAVMRHDRALEQIETAKKLLNELDEQGNGMAEFYFEAMQRQFDAKMQFIPHLVNLCNAANYATLDNSCNIDMANMLSKDVKSIYIAAKNIIAKTDVTRPTGTAYPTVKIIDTHKAVSSQEKILNDKILDALKSNQAAYVTIPTDHYMWTGFFDILVRNITVEIEGQTCFTGNATLQDKCKNLGWTAQIRHSPILHNRDEQGNVHSFVVTSDSNGSRYTYGIGAENKPHGQPYDENLYSPTPFTQWEITFPPLQNQGVVFSNLTHFKLNFGFVAQLRDSSLRSRLPNKLERQRPLFY
uniref:Uncharacterized protein n=2 Tax=Mucochytrium quahogii TaxID=96639 RepID=A0A7S2SAB5_9STRA|mmetsp:Transcript_3054/g.6457  ORF Transcript_3054/g.6457 Transcript_3054/m.6457 type:complete len:1235 (+) Transcript_3054:112-3816(+)